MAKARATFIPAEPPDRGPGALAERAFFEALRQGLSEGWFVYHRLAYLDPGTGREREADFVLLHRQHGLLVVECKGHGVRRRGDGKWVRLDGTNEVPTRDPFEQSRTAVHELRKTLEARIAKALPEVETFPFLHGHAVTFPLADCQAVNLPLDVQRELVLDSRDCDHIEDRLLAALALFGRSIKRPPPLSETTFKQFRKRVLHPALDLAESLGSMVRAEDRLLVSLTEEQLVLLDGLLASPRYLVEGGAGTGKTLLALEASRRFAEDGHRVLLACFNKALGAHLESLVENEELPGSIEATTFHRLCHRAHRARTGDDLPVPSAREDQHRFWLEEAPLLLLDAVAEGTMPRYTALVVDEAQDFADSWWDVLFELLDDHDSAPILVLGDVAQDLFKRSAKLPKLQRFALTRNLRQTQALAETSARLGRNKTKPAPRAPLGDGPVISEQPSPGVLQRRLDELVADLLKGGLVAEQIVVLSPHTKPHSSLAAVTTIGGLAVSTDLADRAGKLLHTSIGAFKGLEADVIILIDIMPDDPRADQTARYVAASRARHRLYVFCRGELWG